MLKVYAFLTGLGTHDQASFSAHWRHPHGTLTKRIPHIRRYVQNHATGAPIAGIVPGGWSGVAAIWLDDAAAMGAAAGHPDWPELDADGDLLYDRDKLVWLMTEETPVVAADPGPARQVDKLILFLKARERRFEAAGLIALAGSLGARLPGVIASRVALPVEDAPAFDGVIELDADDGAFVRWAEADIADIVGGDVSLAGSRAMTAREERVIWPERGPGGKASA